MSETNETKKTRNTLLKKLEAAGVSPAIQSYISPYNEESNRKRLAPFVAQGVISTEQLEEMIQIQKAKSTKKLDGAEMEALKINCAAVCNEHFSVNEEVVRERVSLKDALMPLYYKTVKLTPSNEEILFAVESYFAEQEKKAQENLKKLAAAK